MSEDENKDIIKSTDFLAWYAVYVALANDEPIAIDIVVDQEDIDVDKLKFALRKALWIIIPLALFVLYILYMKFIAKVAIDAGSKYLTGGMM